MTLSYYACAFCDPTTMTKKLSKGSPLVKLISSKFEIRTHSRKYRKRVSLTEAVCQEHTLDNFRTSYNKMRREVDADKGTFFMIYGVTL